MRTTEYWKKRFEKLQLKQFGKADAYYAKLETEYADLVQDVENDLTIWYNKLDDISIASAKRVLPPNELKDYKRRINDWIDDDISDRWLNELERLKDRRKVSRLEEIQTSLYNRLNLLNNRYSSDVTTLFSNIYSNTYYRTIYEVNKGYNLGRPFTQLDTRKIDIVLNNPWTPDGTPFSKRIWINQDKLYNTLNKDLKQSIVRGEDPQRVINTLSKKLHTSKSNAGNLVMTETAYFSSVSKKEAFSELDVEKYIIVATLDNRTSDICQSMDNQVFKMSEYDIGVTASPFHNRCRTTEAPYFEDNYTERFARDSNGDTYYVPGDISYKEWKEKY